MRINPYRTFVGSFIPNGLLKYKGVSSTAKLLWARLAQYAGKNGVAWPSQDSLAEEIGVSVTTIKRFMKELIDDGFIECEKPLGLDRLGHKTNRYYFLNHPCLFKADADTSGEINVELSGESNIEPSGETNPELSGEGNTELSKVRESYAEGESVGKESEKENHVFPESSPSSLPGAQKEQKPNTFHQRVYDLVASYNKYFSDRQIKLIPSFGYRIDKVIKDTGERMEWREEVFNVASKVKFKEGWSPDISWLLKKDKTTGILNAYKVLNWKEDLSKLPPAERTRRALQELYDKQHRLYHQEEEGD